MIHFLSKPIPLRQHPNRCCRRALLMPAGIVAVPQILLQRTVPVERTSVTVPEFPWPDSCVGREMCSLLSTLVMLSIQALLVVCSPLQVLAVNNVNFSVYVENQTRGRDCMSGRQPRAYQLYSRTSGKHLQVLGRRISAKGDDGDKYAQLVVEDDTFGSQVRIRGQETNFYLCMNRHGKLFGKNASRCNADCVFIEMLLENHYTALMSARYSGWYVGFSKRGRPRRGPQTLLNQQDVHFMKRPLPGMQTYERPFHFTTVSKRNKRVREMRPTKSTAPT